MVPQSQPNEKLESQIANDSKVVEVKEEPSEVDGASAAGIDVSVAETVDVSSESESASSSEAETDLVSSEDEKGVMEQPLKTPKVARVAESPDLNEVWMQNPSSKIVHAVSKHVSCLGSLSITKCGRRADQSFNSVAVLTDWTAKCRICSEVDDSQKFAKPEVGMLEVSQSLKITCTIKVKVKSWREVLRRFVESSVSSKQYIID